MADITRKEYFDIVEGAAERFAKAYMQINKDVRGSQGDRWLADHPYKEKEMQEQFEKQLRKMYDSEKPDADSLYRLANFSDKEGAAWLASDLHGYSPEQKEKSVEAAKFLPLLYGPAQPGEDWYSRGVLDLKNKAVEDKLGYDVGTKEGTQKDSDKANWENKSDEKPSKKSYRAASYPRFGSAQFLCSPNRHNVIYGEDNSAYDTHNNQELSGIGSTFGKR